MARFVSRLRIIADNTDEAVALALKDTAHFILLLIRIYAPVDTGTLRDSYEIEEISQLHLLIGSMLLYSIFQEFGTVNMAAQPHVTPAFWQAREFFLQQLKRRMEENN